MKQMLKRDNNFTGNTQEWQLPLPIMTAVTSTDIFSNFLMNDNMKYECLYVKKKDKEHIQFLVQQVPWNAILTEWIYITSHRVFF